MFSDNINQSVKLYRNYLLKADSKEVIDLFNKSKRSSIWGSKDFMNEIKEKFFKQKLHKDIPESMELAPDIGDIIGNVCDIYGVGKQDLKKIRRGRSNEPRDVAVYLMRMLKGESLEVIGKEFSLNRFSSVSSILQKMKLRLMKDQSLQRKVEKIKNKILKKGQT